MRNWLEVYWNSIKKCEGMLHPEMLNAFKHELETFDAKLDHLESKGRVSQKECYHIWREMIPINNLNHGLQWHMQESGAKSEYTFEEFAAKIQKWFEQIAPAE